MRSTCHRSPICMFGITGFDAIDNLWFLWDRFYTGEASIKAAGERSWQRSCKHAKLKITHTSFGMEYCLPVREFSAFAERHGVCPSHLRRHVKRRVVRLERHGKGVKCFVIPFVGNTRGAKKYENA